MPSPYNKLRSKLNRAIAAYLVSLNDANVGTVNDIAPANNASLSSYPNTTIRATISRPEVQLTGLRRIAVHISIKGSAVKAVNETNTDLARKNFDARVGATYDALMLTYTADGQTLQAMCDLITAAGRALATSSDATIAANNADMADFTLQSWYDDGEGDGEADAEGCSWEEILMFQAVCSPSNVD